MTAGHILVVEDEADLAELIAFNLRQNAYEVTVSHEGKRALEILQRESIDLVLLDIMLPDILGTEVCRQVRKAPNLEHLPVVMLTAKGEEVDRVVGFELGADDYLTKPFSPRELVLRVSAVLRRFKAAASAEAPRANAVASGGADGGAKVLGPIRVDPERHEVYVGGEAVNLTALEFRLLLDLMAKPGRVQTREGLLDRVWGYAAGVGSRTVDTHVKRLREKLGVGGDVIETVRGVGYRVQDLER